MRVFFHLTFVIPAAVIAAIVAFAAFSIGMTAEWIRDAVSIRAPIFVSATQRARRLRRRV